jgi:hypothetical protein
MQWNFGAIIDYISDIISPGVPLSDAHTAMVKNLINGSQGGIAVSFPITELKVPDQFIRTVADYATGTVTATDNSAALVGDSTVWTYQMIGRKIQISGESVYYTVVNVTSNTALTLDRPYNGTTTAALTYNLFENSYDIPDEIGATGWVKGVYDPAIGNRETTEKDWDYIESLDPSLQHTGEIEHWALIGNKNIREPYGTTYYGADAGTTTTSVIEASASGAVDDYYKDWSLVNVTRGKTAKITAYVASTHTFTLEEAIAGQTTADEFFLYKNAPQITFYRRPNTEKDLLIKGYKAPERLINLYDIPALSEDFLDLIAADVLTIYYNKDATQQAIWSAVSEREEAKLKSKYARKVGSRQRDHSFNKRGREMTIAVQD